MREHLDRHGTPCPTAGREITLRRFFGRHVQGFGPDTINEVDGADQRAARQLDRPIPAEFVGDDALQFNGKINDEFLRRVDAQQTAVPDWTRTRFECFPAGDP